MRCPGAFEGGGARVLRSRGLFEASSSELTGHSKRAYKRPARVAERGEGAGVGLSMLENTSYLVIGPPISACAACGCQVGCLCNPAYSQMGLAVSRSSCANVFIHALSVAAARLISLPLAEDGTSAIAR
mgnify:CR=1 FL=1